MTPLEAACASLTGTLTFPDDPHTVWECTADPYTGTFTDLIDLLNHAGEVLVPFCGELFVGEGSDEGNVILEATWYCLVG
ncbi:hypothetical protein GCM10025870_14530 [Agromyces marinus]|uniref:Uncharacterized protein n=2 Tax=Agromyces marinus TaxID=1389020 RepID=A0ABM8H0W5_9MICO|nr:hypothetical protein [Agromyces marinus]BDZ54380.1 hypothetical protein GCM10025870_14530 [Agromyces marinus]